MLIDRNVLLLVFFFFSTPLLGPSNLEPDLFSFEPGPSSLQPSRSSLEPGPSSPQPGPSTSARSRSDKIDDKLYYAVLALFPDTCPNYIKSLCREKTYCLKTLDDITTTILSGKLCLHNFSMHVQLTTPFFIR